MSQLLEIITDNQADDKKHAKKKVNFIQKNKESVSKTSGPSKPQSTQDIVIRYLNDNIDDSIKVITSKTRIELNNSNDSNKSNKENELDQSNQIEFEISIISNHDSSIVTDNDEITKTNHLIQGDEYKPESDLIFSSNYLKLNQIKTTQNNELNNSDNECNIIKSDENKSKVRSQFIQRFGKKKHQQIIPNIIDGTPLTTTTVDSTPSTLQYESRFNQFKPPDQDALTTASIAASLAAMSVVNAHQQPLVKIQNDLEEKIQSVLKELESLRRSDEKINDKLKRKKRDSYCSDDECVSIRKNIESESRIKYLEKLQEKQFDMMSQLINVIGTENSQAFLTAQNGKDNLNKFKKQIDDTLDNVYDEYDDEDEDYIKFKNNLNKKSQQTKSKSRSRSQTRKTNNKKTTTTIPNEKKKSTSPSASRSCCKMRNSPNKKSNLKKTEFLENLLGDVKQIEPEVEQPIELVKQPLKSATYSIITNNMNDETQHPLLFDKYLNEVKTKIKESESLSESKTVDEKNNSKTNELIKKPSMFSDIKEVLKAVEYSKAKIDASLAELTRERDNKMFYLLNSDEKNDRLRIKKMVDGCINAIADDVKKEVDQKLIDESKHAKLNAEKDTNAAKSFKRHMKTQLPVKQQKGMLRSASATNLPTTSASNVSHTRKYIDKLFGKSLLDQIKLDKTREANRELENRLKDQQRLRKELELKIQKEMSEIEKTKSKPFKNIANTKPQPKMSASTESMAKVDPNHDKIVITPRLVLDPNHLPQMPNIQPLAKPIYSQVNYQDPRNNNVALVTLPDVQQKFITKPKKELIKQNLPPLNISPEFKPIDSDTRSIHSTSNIPNENKNNEETFDVNQTGTGIEIPGYRRGYNSNVSFNKSAVQNSTLINDKHISELANEANQLSKQLDIFENKTYNWLEQELMARFISKLAQSEPHVHDADKYSNDFEDQSESSEQIDLKDLELINALGQQGLQLFVDLGQPVDQDLIQVLIREVLEEKIASIASNKEDTRQPIVSSLASNVVPIPSPRARKSVDTMFNDNQQIQFNYDVKTPVLTPSQSPPLSPRHPALTPQISVEQPQVVQPIIEPLRIKEDEEESTILEKTIDEFDDDVEIKSIEVEAIMVETPKETPSPSPVPDQMRTPSESSESEKIIPIIPVIQPIPVKPVESSPHQSPPPPPQPPIKSFRSKSMQCDEPIIQVKSVSDTSSDITESSQYTSDDLSSSTTISSKLIQKSDDEVEDTYISEGAWLISKSEGEIKPIKLNDYTDGLNINIGKPIINLNELNTDTSDGETRPEKGEIKRVVIKDTEKSEGELESTKASNSKKESIKHKTSNKQKSNLKVDKTIVDLKLSPNGKSKNKIRIESLSAEMKNRDSNDFDRKLFSSTPDTTLNRAIPTVGKQIQDLNELLDNEYSSDEQEIELEYTP